MIVNGGSVPRPRNYLSVNYYSKHCLIQKIVCKIRVIQQSWQTKLSKVKCCSTFTETWNTFLSAQKISGSSYLSLESCQPPDPEDLARPENTKLWSREAKKDWMRPANHRVVGVMTGVVGIAGNEQIRRRRLVEKSSPWRRIVEMRGERLGRMRSHPGRKRPQCWLDCRGWV